MTAFQLRPAEEELAGLLAAGRREGRHAAALPPDLVPPARASAYRVAERVAGLLGWNRGGWKVGATNARAAFGDGPQAGDVVSTGTCTGMIPPQAGEVQVGDFGSLGKVEVRFSPRA